MFIDSPHIFFLNCSCFISQIGLILLADLSLNLANHFIPPFLSYISRGRTVAFSCVYTPWSREKTAIWARSRFGLRISSSFFFPPRLHLD